MINKTIISENKKYNLKDVFMLRASSISTIYDINKEAKDIINKYYLYESFNGHVLVFADYDTQENIDTSENNNLELLIDYFLYLFITDKTISHFISLNENPTIIYIEKRKDKHPEYQLVNSIGFYAEVMYESPQYRMTAVSDYCTELINYIEANEDDKLKNQYLQTTPNKAQRSEMTNDLSNT